MKGNTIDHDRRFKRLLSLFFREFLELFWPQFAAEIDWSRGLEFLDKEIEGVLPKSRRRAVDMLVKAHTKRRVEAGRRERLVLLHVEIQAGLSRAELGRRMHRYFHRVLDRFELPVVPIALYLQLHGDGIGWQSYDLTYWGQCFNHFEFAYVALPVSQPRSTSPRPIRWPGH